MWQIWWSSTNMNIVSGTLNSVEMLPCQLEHGNECSHILAAGCNRSAKSGTINMQDWLELSKVWPHIWITIPKSGEVSQHHPRFPRNFALQLEPKILGPPNTPGVRLAQCIRNDPTVQSKPVQKIGVRTERKGNKLRIYWYGVVRILQGIYMPSVSKPINVSIPMVLYVLICFDRCAHLWASHGLAMDWTWSWKGDFKVLVKTQVFTSLGGHNLSMFSEPWKNKVPRSEGIYIYINIYTYELYI